MTDALKIILFILVLVGIVIGIYYIKRWFNYSFGYESQVIESVCGMIKPEYLIDPTVCPK